MAHVFISYSHADREFVDRLAADLQRAGVNVWLDRYQIQAGEMWADEIQTALTNAAAIIFVASQKSLSSAWTIQELDFAAGKGVRLLPVMIDDYAMGNMPPFLRVIQWLDLRADYAGGLARLLAALPADVRSTQSVQPEAQKSKGYVFISFAEADTDFVVKLREFLAAKGYAFWDFQSSDRNYHTALFLELEQAIIEATAMLSVLSPDWKRSKWAPREFLFAEDVNVPVFFLMARTMGPTLVTVDRPYIDFVADVDQGLQRLDHELRRKGLL